MVSECVHACVPACTCVVYFVVCVCIYPLSLSHRASILNCTHSVQDLTHLSSTRPLHSTPLPLRPWVPLPRCREPTTAALQYNTRQVLVPLGTPRPPMGGWDSNWPPPTQQGMWQGMWAWLVATPLRGWGHNHHLPPPTQLLRNKVTALV